MPTPTPDLRYGVILHTSGDPQAQRYFLNALGVQWYLDYRSDPAASGSNKVLFVSVRPAQGRLTSDQISQIAQASPGAYWYLGGEANVAEQDGLSGAKYAPEFYYYATQIKAVDPNAHLMSASVLNWDFTCLRPEPHGCGWDYSGREWANEFRTAYLALYGQEPPVEVWSLDAYPLDWVHLPTVNPQIVIDQVAAMRGYLDSIPGQAGKPIWITEVGLHWGYDGLRCFTNNQGVYGCMASGQYHQQAVLDYLTAVFDWLEANSVSMNVQRWFLFNSYHDLTAFSPAAYAGLTLFDGPNPGANLTPTGDLFRRRALGYR